MTLHQELLLFRALRLIARCVNVILYNQLMMHGDDELAANAKPQRELQDDLRRLIDEL